MYLWVGWDATRDLGANKVWSQYRYGPFTLPANAEQRYTFTLDEPPMGKQFRSVVIFWADNYPKQEFDEKSGWLIRNTDGSVQAAPSGNNGPSFILPSSGQSITNEQNNNPQNQTPQQTQFDGTYDYYYQFNGPGGPEQHSVLVGFIVQNGQILSNPAGEFTGTVDADGNANWQGPCPLGGNIYTANFSGQIKSDGTGAGMYTCLSGAGGSWSVRLAGTPQPTQQQTTPSAENIADYKKMECVDKYGTGFYYDASQDKCFPPSGSWQNPGIDYYSNYCQAQYGSGFYFDTSQNACLPPGGSWQNPGPTYYDHQCEDNFWPDFHYDASQNACMPPSGSWPNFAPPQTGITDQQGTVTFQIAGQSVPFKFADDKTGSSLSGLEVSFALDAKTQSIGTLLIIDPTKHYPMQIITLTGSPSSNSNIPTAWQSRLIPHAYAQTSLTNQALIYLDDHPLALASMAVLAGGLLTGGPLGLAAAAAGLEVVDLAVESVKLAARAADKAGWLPPVGILGNGVETKIVSPSEASKEAAVEAGVETGKATLLLGSTIKETSGKMYGANLVGLFINGALDAYAISHCDTTKNNIYRVSFVGESYNTCKAKDDTYGLFYYNPPSETEHISLELVSKANKGFFESVQTDSGTPIPVPADDYSVRISAPGKQPINQDVQITPQQTTTVKTALQAIPSNNVAVNPPQIQVLGGTCTVNQYCDILIATATDGLAPYYFKSDTFANGAPPFGMTIGIYGHLTGTPTQPGQYNVPVCVTDAAGKSSCSTATVNVNSQNNPLPITGDLSGTWQGNFIADYSRTDDFGVQSCKMQGTFTFDVTKNDDGSFYGTATATVPDNGIIQGDCGAWGSAPNNIGMTITVNADGIFSGSTDFWQSTIYNGHFTDTNSIQFNWKYTDPDGKGTWIGTFTGSK